MRIIIAILAAGLLAAGAGAHEFTAGDLVIDHPWSPPTLAGQAQGAVYLTVRNTGETPDRLVGARTDAAAHAEFHVSEITDEGVARMTPRDDIAVPAGGQAVFAPGGAHIMLIDLAAPMALEDHLTLTLSFEHAGDVEVTVNGESLADHLQDAPAEEHRH